jgi:two-component system OmpR family sensor kinase
VATIEISDEGPGVAEADLARLFEPFYRGDPADGVGLGLAIARRVAELHGGRIEAENRASGGLRVSLSLPTAPSPVEAEGQAAREPA